MRALTLLVLLTSMAAPGIADGDPGPRRRVACKAGQRRVCAVCAPGRECPCFCAGRGDGAIGLIRRLCPAGTRWRGVCPAGIRCAIGGRCVPIARGKCPEGMRWAPAPKGRGTCALDAEKAPVKPLCPPGAVLAQVHCVAAPCPALCLPARPPPGDSRVKPL
jgi:hypothetical protein